MESTEWTAKSDEELTIPAEYLEGLRWEVLVLSAKKTFTFRCVSYNLRTGICTFRGVIMDTSTRNSRGAIILQRVSYHQEIVLANVGFMAIPVPAVSPSPDG